ncbi:DNA translocase FtsK [Pontibacillus sp. HMF3514]|uniref:DNA translocase FtsK n=1 Tax=Pontibacillus sp. HMF3514 TaxID=2692425 RepID=UPI001F42A45D|nr:DNA translocase FtsK [Pontibacillus sp. HMF3514]
MKKWLHHVLQEDTSTEDELPDSSQSVGGKKLNNEFQTKMVYQYPKQGEFRFPVIPDDKKGMKRSRSSEPKQHQEEGYNNKQPYQNSQTDTYNRKEYRDSGTQSYNTSYKESYTENTSQKETEEDMPYPFVPSDVPSPIYGFGSRSEQDEDAISLEDLPAFLRKQNEESPEASFQSTHSEKAGGDILEEQRMAGSSGEVNKHDLINQSDKIVPFLRVQEEESTEEADEDEQHENPHYEVEEDQEGAESDQEEKKSFFMDFGEEEPVEEQTTEESINEEQSFQGEAQEVAQQEDAELVNGNEPQPEPESEVESETELQSEPESEVESETEPQSEPESEVESETDPQPEPESEFEVETEPQSEPESEFEVETESESTPESELETDRESETQPESPSEIAPEPERSPKKNRRPFNVIMTPRDKRNRDLKASEEAKERKQKTEEPAPVKEEEVKGQEAEEVSFDEVVKDSTPPMHMLNDPISRDENDDAWIEDQMQLLETTLQHFHVKAKVVNAMKGPAVTRFEVQPEPGVKVSKITNLADDIKLSLAAKDIRIEAPIPGKNAIGIEVPNQQAQAVSLQEILENPSFKDNDSPLSVGLGLDIAGSPVITDLKKMPHGLIAGATGSGKSVCINTILISLLYKANYEDVKFLLIDPKMVELAPYNDLPHLVAPVITDVKAATSALKWAVKEMEERYEKFVAEGVRDIDRYNEKMKEKGRKAEKMPYMVIVIDELADLMMVSPQDVEDAICRIAQKARACGMHLLLATQRPSVDVITGLIKANIPTRVAFSVSSQVDSRTIIDTNGAEKLLGKGDMLFLENGSGKGQRIQGAFVSDDEIERIANYVKKIAPPNYMFEQEELMKQTSFEEEEDELFEDAVDFVINQNGASASLLQRRFKVGYNRAARLIDTMEEKGIISGSKGSKPREVHMTHASFKEYLAREKE